MGINNKLTFSSMQSKRLRKLRKRLRKWRFTLKKSTLMSFILQIADKCQNLSVVFTPILAFL
jgi:hypothetical protein